MKMLEVYVRGNSIKYVTIPEEVLDMVQEEDLSKESKLLKPQTHICPSSVELFSSRLERMVCCARVVAEDTVQRWRNQE